MKKKSDTIVEKILLALKGFPDGASITEMMEVTTLPKRTLQRYLAHLIKRNSIEGIGNARSRRYCLSAIKSKSVTPPIGTTRSDQKDLLIPLSSIAIALQEKVRQPIQLRQPIGYKREFLDQYIPNKTFYLSESIRSHLLDVGKPLQNSRPAGTYARQILNRLLIDLSWNSSRLEGNTYSLLETERLLELGETPEGKDSKEAQMILNHIAAIEFMVDSADQLQFDSFTILNLHALLSDNLLRDQRACGCLRTSPVGIAKSIYQPTAVPQLIEDCFQQILIKAGLINDPYEQSFFAMVHLPYLQPFLDVNKRVSRLAANIPFIRDNLCPLSFVDLPEQTYVSGLMAVYELNRIELLREIYIWAYERSSSLYLVTRQELGEPDPFRLRYRSLIIAVIGEIVRSCLDKPAAVAAIRDKAEKEVEKSDRARFIEVIEAELMSLHIGNIARFRLRPSEYENWLKEWH